MKKGAANSLQVSLSQLTFVCGIESERVGDGREGKTNVVVELD
jgi:hypothetical protein